MTPATLCEIENGCDGRVTVRLTKEGACELGFYAPGDGMHTFQCSLSALIDVGLGAKTHLASHYGACVLAKRPGGVRIEITPWSGGSKVCLVPLDSYADALENISHAEIASDRFSLR
jgi:hypothetical protein